MIKAWFSGLTLASILISASFSVQAGEQQSAGFALELQGLQSHDSDLTAPAGWLVENKYNEVGLAARWEWGSQWFVEGRASRGGNVRYLLETGEDEEGNPEYFSERGRSYGFTLAAGKRIWLNEYFSVMPSIGYMQRGVRSPDVPQHDLEGSRDVSHSAIAGVSAEYRVISRFAVSLNFIMLSSGERQQGLGIAYYFY